MDAERAEAVAGVTQATPDDDLTTAAQRAVAGDAHLALCALGVTAEPSLLRVAAALLDADRGVASLSLVDRTAISALERGPDLGEAHVDRLTNATLSDTLRRLDLAPLSVEHPGGPVIVISRHALSLVPEFPDADRPDMQIRAWSSAAAARALTHLVWVRELVEVRHDIGRSPAVLEAPIGHGDDPATRHARRQVRVATRGLRVHIDGRTLEAAETGTEVHTLQLIRGIAARPEVSYVGVNLRGEIPPYARQILADRRINAVEHCGEWRADLPEVDVFHRPYQPLSREDCDLWRRLGARTACHMQDLITYLSPAYHPSTEAWHDWRRSVHAAMTAVDGAFTISDYVREQMLREGMRGEPELLWNAPCGVDHVTMGAELEAPPELEGRARPFGLVLGSTYGHKNVDLAMAAVDRARESGTDLSLVTAGRQVEPASRVDEADPARVHLGRNVTAAERNWLLANAALVVFATSAEGFGLVPFEAAAHGTPTVCVRAGALGEHLGPLPVETPDWSVESFASSILQIVKDPAAAAAQVAAVRRAATNLTWDRTVSIVLRGYQEILRRPARG